MADLNRYTTGELEMINDVLSGNGEKHHCRPYDLFILETPDGDKWQFDNLEEARRNQYLFGGTITKGFKNEH